MSGSVSSAWKSLEFEAWTAEKKRKRSVTKKMPNCKKSRSRNDTGNARSRNDVINLGIQHADGDEHAFESIDTPALIKCLELSQTLKFLAGNILIKWLKGKMLEACKSGETKVVQLLLERFNSEESGLNSKDKIGMTGFMWACYNGHKDVVQLVLDHSERIELNARSKNENTAFTCACLNGHKDVVKLLLDNSERIELNAINNSGRTALMAACQSGQKDVVKLILDHSERIDLYATDRDGWTALMYACNISSMQRRKDVIQLFHDYHYLF